MQNLFHAPFNAALLHTVALAYPEAAVSFWAEPGHMDPVREVLREHAPELLEQITWRELPVTAKNSLFAKGKHNRHIFRELLGSGDRLLFCSVSRLQLLQLTQMVQRGMQVRVVLHGELDHLLHAAADRFPGSLLSLPRILQRKKAARLGYVVLGRSIHESIPEPFQKLFAHAAVIDHPYHFLAPERGLPGPLIFGIFGKTGHGYLLEAVGRRIQEVAPGTRLRLIGFVNPQAVDRLRPLVEEVEDRPIARSTYIERARSITHVLWLSERDAYDLRASGTFFDALSYGKPLVYTANRYIDHYIALEPEVGLRCESSDDVPEALLELSRTFDQERYAAAQRALLRLRERFTPEAQAVLLPAAFAWD